MLTEIKKINKNSLEQAKKLLESDQLVVFPTETVYGLGANAFSDEAIKKIYEVKGRPSNNPLIVHVHSDYDIDKLVYRDYDYVFKLADKFLPGPLTMVYRSKGVVSPLICGLGTLAIRIPEHKGCQEFLKYVNMPIPAPSANISKHVSPTTAEHCLADLNGRVELILQGGKSDGGIESTVVDCTGEFPVILRKGLVTKEMIESVCGRCEYAQYVEGQQVSSPGVMYAHYMPNCKTALFKIDEIEQAKSLYMSYIKSSKKPYIMCDFNIKSVLGNGYNFLELGSNSTECASNLYERLRDGEKVADIIIAFELTYKDEIAQSVMNRLIKACGKGLYT